MGEHRIEGWVGAVFGGYPGAVGPAPAAISYNQVERLSMPEAWRTFISGKHRQDATPCGESTEPER